MNTYNIHDAKTQLSKLVARAEAGEEIVIARDGKPAAKLTPIAPDRPKRVFGQLEGLMTKEEIDALFSPEAEAEIQAMFDGALHEPLFPEEFDKVERNPTAE